MTGSCQLCPLLTSPKSTGAPFSWTGWFLASLEVTLQSRNTADPCPHPPQKQLCPAWPSEHGSPLPGEAGATRPQGSWLFERGTVASSPLSRSRHCGLATGCDREDEVAKLSGVVHGNGPWLTDRSGVGAHNTPPHMPTHPLCAALRAFSSKGQDPPGRSQVLCTGPQHSGKDT